MLESSEEENGVCKDRRKIHLIRFALLTFAEIKKHMRYSIIIAVYNRLEEVMELLASAEKLVFDRSRFELLFVDDGSKDGFKSYIQSYVSSSNLSIRAVFQSNRGPGAARNHGMSVSDADYFIFVDSDCFFPPEWLEQIDTYLQKNNCDAFGGRDEGHPSFSPLLKAINYSMTSFLGTGGTRGNAKSIAKFYPRSFNMGISREVYLKIGGMDEGLRHGQDMDYSARIYEAGFKVCLITSAYVYHKRRTSIRKFYRQIFNWGVARINLYRRHKSMLKPVHFLPAIVLLGVVTILVVVILGILPSLFAWLLISGIVAIALIAFIQSLLKYKQFLPAILSVPVLYIQVFAYGAGFIKGLIQHLLGKEPRGYVKNYYGKK